MQFYRSTIAVSNFAVKFYFEIFKYYIFTEIFTDIYVYINTFHFFFFAFVFPRDIEFNLIFLPELVFLSRRSAEK